MARPSRRPLQRHMAIMASASVLYICAYGLTAYVVAPVQSALFPALVMSLLFLPHGVRVLTAWLYGWRSFAYLLPGAVLCNLHFAGDRAFDPQVLAGTTASLIAAPLALTLTRAILPAEGLARGGTRITTLVAVGMLASVFNLAALGLAFGLEPFEGLVIFTGDSAGLVVSALLLWAALRLAPRLG